MLENLKGKLAPAIILALGLTMGCSNVSKTCESVRTEIAEVDGRLHPNNAPMSVSPRASLGMHMAIGMLKEERAKLQQWLTDNNCK